MTDLAHSPRTGRSVKRGLLVGSAAALVGGAALAGVALAQTPPATPSPSPSTQQQPPTRPAPGAQQQKFLETLASKLGVTVDKLQQAITDSRTEVGGAGPFGRGDEDGRGPGGMLGRHGMPGPGMMPGGPGMMPGGTGMMRGAAGAELDVAASTIGVSRDDLLTQVRQGKSVAQVAQDHGKTAQNVIDAVTADANKRIDQAVTDGKLTADQAQQMKERVSQMVTSFVNRTPPTTPRQGPNGSAGRGARQPQGTSS